MIKLFEFVGRKSGLTSEDFHSYWRDRHAEFFTDTPAVRNLVKRYELNMRLPEDYIRSRHETEFGGPEWDGVAVQWFDSLDDYKALQQLPEFKAFAEQERAHYRAAESAQVLTEASTVIVDKPGRRAEAELKLLCILRRNAALDRATFYPHWQGHHGGLFQNVPELSDPVWAYDQNHGLDLADAQYDGVTEQWFESLPAWIDSLSAPANYDQVAPDVAYMLDANSIQFILAGRPLVILGD